VLAPPGSDKIDIKAGKTSDQLVKAGVKPKMVNFFVPIAALIAATVIFDVDLLKGVYVAIVVTGLLYIPFKVMNMNEFMDSVLEGIKNMLFPLILVVGAFLFAEANRQLGLVAFVLEKGSPILSAQMLPRSSSSSGRHRVHRRNQLGPVRHRPSHRHPAVQAVGADPIIGWPRHLRRPSAVIAASTPTRTILSSAASGCNNFDHAITQMPYALVCAAASLVIS
jgi:Na+/H+ antiporter NhaC